MWINHLVEIEKLCRMHGAKHILIPEPNCFTGPFDFVMQNNPYVRAMNATAQTLDIPLIDVMIPLSERTGEYLFVDYIHPSK